MSKDNEKLHIGRSWNGPGHLEESCLCKKAPCGLVESFESSEGCPQHGFNASKTMRSIHLESECEETQALWREAKAK